MKFYNYVLSLVERVESWLIDTFIYGKNESLSKLFNIRFVYDRDEVQRIFSNKSMRSFENNYQNVIFRRSSTTVYPRSEPDKMLRHSYVSTRFNNKQFQEAFVARYFELLDEAISKSSTYNPMASSGLATKAMLECGFKLNDPDRFIDLVNKNNFQSTMLITILRQNKIFREFHNKIKPEYAIGVKNLDAMASDIINKRDGWDYDNSSWLSTVVEDYKNGLLKYDSAISEVLDVTIPSQLMSLNLTWALYHLSKSKVDIDRIRRSRKWAKYCIMESMRLSPTSFIVFKSENGEKPSLKKAATGKCPVFNIISTYNIHHNKEYYSDPEKYNPSRFIAGIGKFDNIWLPFGGGENLCPGRAFSLKVLSELLYSIVNKYDITTTCHIGEQFMVTLVPKNKYVPIEFRKRSLNDY